MGKNYLDEILDYANLPRNEECSWCNKQMKVVRQLAVGGVVEPDPPYKRIIPAQPRSFNDKVDDIERSFNWMMGSPQEEARRVARKYIEEDEGEDGEPDVLRHANAGRLTAEAIRSWGGDNPLMSVPAFVGSTALGIGHELGTIFMDNRPWEEKGREAMEDIYNNTVGAYYGAVGDKEGEGKIYDAWVNNELSRWNQLQRR